MLDSELETSDEAGGLRRALEAADPATLLLSLVQLTGEKHWLEAAKPFIRGPMNYQEFMPEPLRTAVRDRLAEVLTEIARSGATPRPRADDALLREMMAVATGEAVPDDYIAMMREDLTDDTLASRSLKWRKPPDPGNAGGHPSRHHRRRHVRALCRHPAAAGRHSLRHPGEERRRRRHLV